MLGCATRVGALGFGLQDSPHGGAPPGVRLASEPAWAYGGLRGLTG